MTLPEAIAEFSPPWVSIWVTVLFFGAYVLPLGLLIWPATRMTALVTVVASLLGGIGIQVLFDQMGYVRLLGLPHIIVWVPLLFYLIPRLRRPDFPVSARVMIGVTIAVIVISLVFDINDVARYILGERTPPVTMNQG